MLEIGSIVDGKYKILNKVGQGGMSVVYLAMNERANKQWAIKEVRKDGTQNFEVVKQGLVAETDILKKLSHPSLPSIIDVIDRDDTFLIVMDYIEGNSLSKALEEYGAQPQEYVIEWGIQLCDVLSYLHTRKPPIIYRDMKPANVMLKPDGTVSLIDFGTAREFKSDRVEDTTCLGTQGYAAPEQYGGHGQTDARTDIYCLGATLYHLVTGHNPCEPPYEIYPIREWNPSLSSGLEQIIIKCTKRNPNDRYQNCNELMYALEHYDELDISYKKKQRKSFGFFVASAAMTVIFGTAAVFGATKEQSVRRANYENYVNQAPTMMTEEEVRAAYKSAISLEPNREEAYIALLDHMLEDNVFTQDEDEYIRVLLGTSTGNNITIEDSLKTNQAGYAQFAYKLAMDYWYFYGTVDEGGAISYSTNAREKATQWFGRVELVNNYGGKGVTNQNEYATSQVYQKIGSYQSRLNSGQGNIAGDSEFTYATYWNDLMEAKSIEQTNQVTTLCLAKEIIGQVATNASKFKASGVTEDTLNNEINSIESEMNTLQIDELNQERCQQLRSDILRNIEIAKNSVSAAYNGTGSVTTESGGK